MSNLIKQEEKSLFPILALGKQINRLFGDFFSDFDGTIFKHHRFKEPKVNISEDDKAYYIEAALAGFKKEDIKLNLKNGTISIKAKKEESSEDSKKNYCCIEYSYYFS